MSNRILRIPEPFSAGIFLSYKCNSRCKHCIYASSPRWPADWLSEEDARVILSQLAAKLRGKYPTRTDRVGLNEGIHFTGGEPFLHFPLLLRVTEIAYELGLPGLFVETNCFWCRDDGTARLRLSQLKEAGLQGILISANPFLIEYVPFERIERAARIGREVFGRNAMIYQAVFFAQFQQMGLTGKMPFEEYLEKGGAGLNYMELLPQGRVSYDLARLYRHFPARHFFGESCRQELIRDWHVHIDNYGNYLPGYCSGLSLGDARNLDALCAGIELDAHPVLAALLEDIEALFDLGKQYGYQERSGNSVSDGYISKCHLCLDIRRHLVTRADFPELQPKEFYHHLME